MLCGSVREWDVADTFISLWIWGIFECSAVGFCHSVIRKIINQNCEGSNIIIYRLNAYIKSLIVPFIEISLRSCLQFVSNFTGKSKHVYMGIV
ncbi:hypothetical protein DMENIID0001_144750 [Sergentomyia squamirostris]